MALPPTLPIATPADGGAGRARSPTSRVVVHHVRVLRTVDAVNGQSLDEVLRAESAEQLATDHERWATRNEERLLFFNRLWPVGHVTIRTISLASNWAPICRAGRHCRVTKTSWTPCFAPSKSIRNGYESVSVITNDGLVVVGRLVPNAQQIVVRNASRPGLLLEFERGPG